MIETSNIDPQSSIPQSAIDNQQSFDLVVVGHVDHGKSTLIGRLLADTGSLPQGKLEQVKAHCARTARPFEYAFLLDALKAEQAQGITIDTARCFFSTARRRYIINDAPGHVEFLKNMVTGAARAEAALLLIDAAEGIRENSRRHGTIVSLLGIRQVVVVVNKMDLVNYDRAVFDRIEKEYRAFLEPLGVRPLRFIPISARDGENVATRGGAAPWYGGPTVLEQIDEFERAADASGRPLRLPVQDIYKFTEAGDDRRIVAGTIETGALGVGDEVVFLPSRKRSRIASIEAFNAAVPERAVAGQALGYTLEQQIYIKPGELMVRADERPARVGTRLRATIFWMGRAPLVKGKRYKLKLGAARVPVELVQVLSITDASAVIDSSALHTPHSAFDQVERHDVAEVLLETARPVAFDAAGEIEQTARFVIVDGDAIAGCGVVLDEAGDGPTLLERQVSRREENWEKGSVSAAQRAAQYRHGGKFIVFVGERRQHTAELARHLELRLHESGRHTYYLALDNVLGELSENATSRVMEREEQLLRLGETARMMTDAGLLFITALPEADGYDLEKLRLLNAPFELLVVAVGETGLHPEAAQVFLAEDAAADQAALILLGALCDRGIVHDYEI